MAAERGRLETKARASGSQWRRPATTAGTPASRESRPATQRHAAAAAATAARQAGHAAFGPDRTGPQTLAAALQTAGQPSQGSAAVIAHVVLFRLRPDVALPDRQALIDAWAVALRDITAIRRARIGRRLRVGRAYEAITRTDLPYAAILEFDDLEALRAYLDHPAHHVISTRFFAAVAETLIYDFDMETSAEGLRG